MIISEEFIDKFVEVTRVSSRLMMVKLIVGKCLVNVMVAYAPRRRGLKDTKAFPEHLKKEYLG